MNKKKLLSCGIMVFSLIIAMSLWMMFLAGLVADGVLNIDLLQQGIHDDDLRLTFDSYVLLFIPSLILMFMIAEVITELVKKYGNQKQD